MLFFLLNWTEYFATSRSFAMHRTLLLFVSRALATLLFPFEPFPDEVDSRSSMTSGTTIVVFSLVTLSTRAVLYAPEAAELYQ